MKPTVESLIINYVTVILCVHITAIPMCQCFTVAKKIKEEIRYEEIE